MIATKPLKAVLLAIAMLFSFVQFSYSQEHEVEQASENQLEKAFNAADLINHHIADSHEFHLFDWKGVSYSMPLPIILYTNNGLVAFLSSEFHHNNDGKVVVERKGQKFVRIHDGIFYADKVVDDHPSMMDFSLRPLNFSITKLVFSMLLSVLLLFIIFFGVAKSYKKNTGAPKGLASFMEPLVLFVRDDIAIPNIGRKNYAKYMPYLLSIFFFIWINNLMGLIPFFPFSANVTGNIAFTFVLASLTFLITTLSGNKYYWKHILMPPVPWLLYPIMVPIEIIGMLTKPFALMIRLFANIAAGHIIILSLISLIFIFKSVAVSPITGVFVIFMTMLELLVAALQAYVFTLLSALFIGQAVADDHH
jgi:F-type H+-transporting ATPase subunit a